MIWPPRRSSPVRPDHAVLLPGGWHGRDRLQRWPRGVSEGVVSLRAQLSRRLRIGRGAVAAVLVLAAMVNPSSVEGADSGPVGTDGKLSSCPESPNCVSSDAPKGSHYVAPFEILGEPAQVWAVVLRTVSGWPRTRVVEEGPDFVRAECRTPLLRFVDDLELQLRPSAGLIAVRSASRVGWSDLGVNRKRVEALRAKLREEGVVR